MKRFICVLLVITFLTAVSGCSVKKPIDDITYNELGIPTSSRYSEQPNARCPWDMIIWNENLFVGSGNYDSNAGPIDIWCYDKNENTWKNSGVVPDEEISRFCIIGDTLVAPGIDPAEDWMYGNYYKFNGDKWIKMRRIYDGIHNFDMVKYDGRVFCGLGVKPGKFPIACSYDNGEFFVPVEMYKDGDLLDTSDYQTVRVYDLFAFNNTLYATLMLYDTEEVTCDLYRYENETFVYDKPWPQGIQYVNYTNTLIGGKTEFNGNMFFTTGYLYATADMENFTQINFPNSKTVYDISVYNNALYALCGEQKEDGKYVVSVWKNDSKKITNFHELFNFTYDIPPLSIACHDEGFYVGMGDYKSTHEKNGTILSVDYKTSK